jgi:hypothetical protein
VSRLELPCVGQALSLQTELEPIGIVYGAQLGGLEAAKKLKTAKNRKPKEAKKKKTVKKRKRTDRKTTFPEQEHSPTLDTEGDEDTVLVEALRSTGP